MSTEAAPELPAQLARGLVDERVPDLLLIDELLAPGERALRDRLRKFSDNEVTPAINAYWERAEPAEPLMRRLSELGIMGGRIDSHGCPGWSATAVGLTFMELERGDGSVNAFQGIHSGLAMNAIALLGSDAQRDRWLPQMRTLDAIGAFAMTEPAHGSDVAGLETRARRTAEGWTIDGRKRWIGNAHMADVIVVWARDDDDHVGAFLVEGGTPGLRTAVIEGKTAKRAIWQSDVWLEEVMLPADARLARARTFRDATELLTIGRHNVAWEAIGNALACYEIALAYSRRRTQFGRPLASFQLVQERLAHMAVEIAGMQLLALRISQLLDEGRLSAAAASIAKRNNAAKARTICSDARDLLGGNGILHDFHVARHLADAEAVYSYEGTDAVQALIIGRALTGLNAFA